MIHTNGIIKKKIVVSNIPFKKKKRTLPRVRDIVVTVFIGQT